MALDRIESLNIVSFRDNLGSELLEVTNPSRYFPSEFFYGNKKYSEGNLKCTMCFPDLYEIGMSNNAMRILFDLINRDPQSYCDRVFAVAPDFEALLRKKNLTLPTIREGFYLNTLDYLGFTFGCELGITNMLQVLDLGGLSLRTSDRKESDPVVFAGGPAVTNPLPFSAFVDFVCIGEAEANIQNILDILKKYKGRKERIEHLREIPTLWYPGKKMAIRAIDSEFGKDDENNLLQYYVVPAFQVAQDHGTAEIMRGCPNGCRFCHAGQYYKPYRQRSIDLVKKIVKQNVECFGYREVTLSSLSSGDYPNLDTLIGSLNKIYSTRHISFSLPSLKVSSFSLDILQEISEVRKSGLTFAIETPASDDQRALNKEVPLCQVISIINEAKSRGWKLAKFYFMTGLPFTDISTEEQNIVSFLKAVHDATRINMNINIGTFIPKAHTPFQWARQMSLEESSEHLKSIKKALTSAIPGIKVSYHEPSISFLEGIISRGDNSVCNLVEKAYENGCRLDAWDEYLNWEAWQKSILDVSYDSSPKEYNVNEDLPWDSVSMNVSKEYLKKEYIKASKHELTARCLSSCNHNCGVCISKASVLEASAITETTDDTSWAVHSPGEYVQTIFTYSKTGRASLCSHMAVMRHFEMAFQRSGLDVLFTQGFNPKPRLEFANPISLGVVGREEKVLCELPESQIDNTVCDKLNEALGEGFHITGIKVLPKDPTGRKVSLASNFIGSLYEFSEIKNDMIAGYLDKAVENPVEGFEVLRKENNVYDVKISGDMNMFKTLFPSDFSKFLIAGSCHLERVKCEVSL